MRKSKTKCATVWVPLLVRTFQSSPGGATARGVDSEMDEKTIRRKELRDKAIVIRFQNGGPKSWEALPGR